jgi:methyl-accepting chemotaxis protein
VFSSGQTLSSAQGSALKDSCKSADELREIIPMPNLDNQAILLIIVAVTALAVLLQAIVLLAIFLVVRKATRSLKEEAEGLRSSIMPIIYNVQELLDRVAPQVEATVTDVAAVAHGLRVQTAELGTAAQNILERVRQQSRRVDAMLSSVLDTVDRVGGFMADTVSKPARQLAGLLASAQAIIESLRGFSSPPRRRRSAEDEDTFI